MITVRASSALLALAGLSLAVAGCSGPELEQAPREPAASSEAAEPTTSAPATQEPTEAPTSAEPTPTEEPAPVTLDLSLAANPVFPDGTTPQISESFLGESEWTYSSPDDGQGHWGYSETATGCTVDFYQHHLSPAVTGTADDTAATVADLAEFLGVTPTDLEPNTNTVSWTATDTLGNGVETLSVLQSNDSSTRFTMGRAFRSAGIGVIAVATCPTNDQAVAASAQVRDRSGILAY